MRCLRTMGYGQLEVGGVNLALSVAELVDVMSMDL